MLQKPVILITLPAEGEGKTRRLFCPVSYSLAVFRGGGVPVLAGEAEPGRLASLSDGLLLSGGGDLAPSYYGEEPTGAPLSVDPDRDAFEWALIREFILLKKPVLAVCRGFQVLNCFFGGTLYQSLSARGGIAHDGPNRFHPVRTREGSLLFSLFGECFLVNSAHRQGICALGEGLEPAAFAGDGLVEAFEHQSLPVWGVQFHPERMTGDFPDGPTPNFAPLFRVFSERAALLAAGQKEKAARGSDVRR